MQSVELSVKRVKSLMELENKKFLIVNLRFHGDVLLTKPMIDDLKTNYPNALIDLLVFKGTASLLKDDEFINEISRLEFKEAYKLLSQKNKELGANVPPLIGAYMNLSASMKSFGTALNQKFGDVEETGILISISDIYPNKKERHISTYNIKKDGN